MWELKFTSIWVNWDNCRPITDASHYHRSSMICGEATTIRFTGFLQILAIRWVPEGFVDVGARILWATFQTTNASSKRRRCTTTAWERHQKSSHGSPGRLECSRYGFGSGVIDARRNSVQKSNRFFLQIAMATTSAKDR